jgi:leucyl aminopeptidase
MNTSFLAAAKFKATDKAHLGALILALAEDKKLPDWAEKLDKDSEGAIKKALAASRFEGKKKQILSVLAPSGVTFSQIILVGVGKAKDACTVCFEAAGGAVIAELNKLGVKEATALIIAPKGAKLDDTAAVHFAMGMELKSYRFDKYKTKEKADAKPSFTSLKLVASDAAKTLYETQKPVVDSVLFVRDLVNEPANVIYPETLAAACQTLSKLGVDVEVMGEAKLKKLGCGALLGVGQGSVRESQMVVMRWNGGDKKTAPLAFIGKGVTFDTGGISIKPAGGMEEMIMDMGGAGTVIGLIRALAAGNAKVNAVGVVGLVENMPDGNAQRPGDIVTSMSGQTIEVLNTDAEGRLVLADCLWYTQDRFKPQFMVNLATLTGAILVAIGDSRAGLFSNNDKLAERLHEVGTEIGEPVWRLPLGEEYDRLIDSPVADMKNISDGRLAGSVTAAQFLQRFVNDVPWAHLDIAGTAWNTKGTDISIRGATGYGVRLLHALVSKYYVK